METKKEYKNVHIRMTPEAVIELKKRALDAGKENFSDYLREIIEQATGVDTGSGVSRWGGRRDRGED